MTAGSNAEHLNTLSRELRESREGQTAADRAPKAESVPAPAKPPRNTATASDNSAGKGLKDS